MARFLGHVVASARIGARLHDYTRLAAAAGRLLCIWFLALAMGLQSASVRKLGAADMTTTVLRLTLTGLAADVGLAGRRVRGSDVVAPRRTLRDQRRRDRGAVGVCRGACPAAGYLMNKISWKVGSGHRSSATTASRPSAASRTLSIAGSTEVPKCFASARASPPL